MLKITFLNYERYNIRIDTRCNLFGIEIITKILLNHFDDKFKRFKNEYEDENEDRVAIRKIKINK